MKIIQLRLRQNDSIAAQYESKFIIDNTYKHSKIILNLNISIKRIKKNLI